MGARKKNRAEQIKEAKKQIAFAKLNNCPTSPRKMRKVADMVRGEDVFKALNILQYADRSKSRSFFDVCHSRFKNYQVFHMHFIECKHCNYYCRW